ncbi:hypothetical protein FDP41_002302 [Naegleria fowleri]|uniref:ornithine decarboxylase n=1 Tax=Naegleria fowleri TaxID=5763 RepID=A0A6A5BUW4_NAEFO|nr:uncharacterized protein FDP41_002302 [Naegleria fowleri]KAF0978482.1 hypothetical protein FDP41_002302 [Naegleria fowleri]
MSVVFQTKLQAPPQAQLEVHPSLVLVFPRENEQYSTTTTHEYRVVENYLLEEFENTHTTDIATSSNLIARSCLDDDEFAKKTELILQPTTSSFDDDNEENHVLYEDINDTQYYHQSRAVKAFKSIMEQYFGAEYFPVLDEKTQQPVTLRDIVRDVCKDIEEGQQHLIDLSHVVRQVERWRKAFPRVNPYYAVKCNPQTGIIKIMYMMGCGFDCASLSEIQQVSQACREVDEWLQENPQHYETLAYINKVDVNLVKSKKFSPTTDIIFANPCKQLSHVRHARDSGVEWTTLDSVIEIEKLSKNWKHAKGVIRIKTADSNSAFAFSGKFGVSVAKARELFVAAKEHNVELCGVSFHVGSGCRDVQAYVQAVNDAKKIFEMAEQFGFQFNLLDIGGGFLGGIHEKPSVEDVASNVAHLIDELFPPHVQVISEPGRYIATATSTLVCSIFTKKDLREENELYYQQLAEQIGAENVVRDKDDFIYYVNDGIYGSFNNIYFDAYKPTFNTTKTTEEMGSKRFKSTVFGPTCDCLDVIAKNYELPEMNVGDYFFFPNFGAYTTSASSSFNGFKASNFYYIWRN